MAFYDLKSYKAPPPNSINQENQNHLVLKGGEIFPTSQWWVSNKLLPYFKSLYHLLFNSKLFTPQGKYTYPF